MRGIPHCPVCRQRLGPDTWFAFEDVCFCCRVECFGLIEGRTARYFIERGIAAHEFQMVHGIKFWCPEDPNRSTLTLKVMNRFVVPPGIELKIVSPIGEQQTEDLLKQP